MNDKGSWGRFKDEPAKYLEAFIYKSFPGKQRLSAPWQTTSRPRTEAYAEPAAPMASASSTPAVVVDLTTDNEITKATLSDAIYITTVRFPNTMPLERGHES